MFSRAGKVRGSMAVPAASMGKGAAEAPRSGLSPPCGPQTVLETAPLSALRDAGTTCQHWVLETPICERNPGTPATTPGHLWEKPGHRWDDTRPGGRETQAHTPHHPRHLWGAVRREPRNLLSGTFSGGTYTADDTVSSLFGGRLLPPAQFVSVAPPALPPFVVKAAMPGWAGGQMGVENAVHHC